MKRLLMRIEAAQIRIRGNRPEEVRAFMLRWSR